MSVSLVFFAFFCGYSFIQFALVARASRSFAPNQKLTGGTLRDAGATSIARN